MGEKRLMFVDLIGFQIESLDYWTISKPLEEIACGICNFGDLGEWRQWLLYLLPRSLSIQHDTFSTDIRELLVTATFGLYPNQISPLPYPEFRADLLLTLGRCMMGDQRWAGEQIIPGKLLHQAPQANDRYPWWCEAHPEFSALMMLHLKYLTPSEVSSWLQSVTQISDPFWRSQLLVWLVGSEKFLSVSNPISLSEELPSGPKVDWSWSHLLKGEYVRQSGDLISTPLISLENRISFWQAASQVFSQKWLRDWRTTANKVPHLLDQTLLTINSDTALAQALSRQQQATDAHLSSKPSCL